MTLELFFVGGSFVVGVTQMAEARILIRNGGRLTRAVAVTSSVEFAWMVFCAYLLMTGSLEFARWLAIMFLAYNAVGIVVVFLADRGEFKCPPDPIVVPKSVATLAGVFGATFAAAALVLLAT